MSHFNSKSNDDKKTINHKGTNVAVPSNGHDTNASSLLPSLPRLNSRNRPADSKQPQNGSLSARVPGSTHSRVHSVNEIRAITARRNLASTDELIGLALSDQPLTGSTSLMELLAPEVQSYILQLETAAKTKENEDASNSGNNTDRKENDATDQHSNTVFTRRRSRPTASLHSSSSPPRHSGPTLRSTVQRRLDSLRHRSTDPLSSSPVAAVARSYLRQRIEAEAEGKSHELDLSEFKPPAPIPSSGSGISRGQRLSARAQHGDDEAETKSNVDTPSGSQSARNATHDHAETTSDGSVTSRGPSRTNRWQHGRKETGDLGKHGSQSLSFITALDDAVPQSTSTSRHRHTDHSTLAHVPLHNFLDEDGLMRVDIAKFDRWPAVNESKKARHLSHTLHTFDESLMTTQPRLLVELESYVTKEFRARGLAEHDDDSASAVSSDDDDDSSPSSPTSRLHATRRARLSIYSEVLRKFLNHFPVYRPLLTRIFREYDRSLDDRDRTDELVKKLRHKIDTMHLGMERQMDVERAEWKRQEAAYLSAQSRLEDQLQSRQASSDHLRDERDQLSNELQNLRATHRDLLLSHQTLQRALTRYANDKNAAVEAATQESEVKQQLLKQVEELKKQQEALLQEMSLIRSHASSMHGINHVEFQRLSHAHSELQTQLKQLSEKHASRSAEYFNLLASMETLQEEKKELEMDRMELDRMRRCCTPRPQWQRLLDKSYLPDFVNISTQSSEALLDELCGEIDRLRGELAQWELKYPSEEEVRQIEEELKEEGAKIVAAKYLKTRGTGDDVPLYLRYGKPGGKVRNKNLCKKDTEQIVKDFWSEKFHTPPENGGEEYRRMDVGEFFYTFLKSRYGFHDAVCINAYSIIDALERFRFDGDCDLLLNILNGTLSECVYLDQFSMLSSLREAFVAADAETHKGKIKGRLPRKVVLDVLAKFFTSKPERNLRRLNRALFVNARSEIVAYDSLFQEDREGNQGPFVECVRDQHLSEIVDFMDAIKSKLEAKSKRYDGKLTLHQIREVIQLLDPTKPAKEVDGYLANGLRTSVAALPDENETVVDPETFFHHMSRGLIKRTGPPPVDKKDLAELARRGSMVLPPSRAGDRGTGETNNNSSRLGTAPGSPGQGLSRRDSCEGGFEIEGGGGEDGQQQALDNEPRRMLSLSNFHRSPTNMSRRSTFAGAFSRISSPQSNNSQQQQQQTPIGSPRHRSLSEIARRLSLSPMSRNSLTLQSGGGGGSHMAQIVMAAAAQAARADITRLPSVESSTDPNSHSDQAQQHQLLVLHPHPPSTPQVVNTLHPPSIADAKPSIGRGLSIESIAESEAQSSPRPPTLTAQPPPALRLQSLEPPTSPIVVSPAMSSSGRIGDTPRTRSVSMSVPMSAIPSSADGSAVGKSPKSPGHHHARSGSVSTLRAMHQYSSANRLATLEASRLARQQFEKEQEEELVALARGFQPLSPRSAEQVALGGQHTRNRTQILTLKRVDEMGAIVPVPEERAENNLAPTATTSSDARTAMPGSNHTSTGNGNKPQETNTVAAASAREQTQHAHQTGESATGNYLPTLSSPISTSSDDKTSGPIVTPSASTPTPSPSVPHIIVPDASPAASPQSAPSNTEIPPAAAPSPLFTPSTSASIAMKKAERLNRRKSGGLATLLQIQQEEEEEEEEEADEA